MTPHTPKESPMKFPTRAAITLVLVLSGLAGVAGASAATGVADQTC